MDIAENYCASKNYRFCGIYNCSGSHHRFRKLRVIPHARTKDPLVCTLAAPHSQLHARSSTLAAPHSQVHTRSSVLVRLAQCRQLA